MKQKLLRKSASYVDTAGQFCSSHHLCKRRGYFFILSKILNCRELLKFLSGAGRSPIGKCLLTSVRSKTRAGQL